MFGEPWRAAESAMDEGAVPALKENIGLLDENIGMFCDDTRDAVKGSALKIKRPGFINGAKEKEDDVIRGISACCLPGEYRAKAPSQIITYVSAHDNQTLWDKLTETLPGTDEEERMRLNRMAAALYMTCQGTLFFLSGEEFARTKDGQEDTFNAPITLNRLDWSQAWQNRSLVEYYKGLIALRKQLPGLCDKSRHAAERIYDVEKEPGMISFCVDNRSVESQSAQNQNAENRSAAHRGWDELKVIYNNGKEKRTVETGGDGWVILCDGESSRRWESVCPAAPHTEVSPQSVLVLARACPNQQSADLRETKTSIEAESGEIWRRRAV